MVNGLWLKWGKGFFSYNPNSNLYTLPTPTPTVSPTEFSFGTFNPESGTLPPVVRGTTSSLKVLISLNGLGPEEAKPTFSAETNKWHCVCLFFNLLVPRMDDC